MKAAQKGDIGECSFLLQALKRGFVVAKPFGSAESYDFILDTGKKLLKVQVKGGNANKKGNAYFSVSTFMSNLKETKHKFNVLACFDLKTGDCYLIPSKYVTSNNIKIGRGKTKLAKYKNNWAIFK